MLIGSVALSVILIAFGFQTASAIVVGVVGGRLLTFYTCKPYNTLYWADRGVRNRLEFETVRAQPPPGSELHVLLLLIVL
jgi:hypothetical protein